MKTILLFVACLMLACSSRYSHCPNCGADLSKGFTAAAVAMGPDSGKLWQQCHICDWEVLSFTDDESIPDHQRHRR